mmetsp:Transcript_4552/g.15145  ORF Transcript_4552/g.15145 Transcript_4552/m.15145 type:complete len:213 (+) Transcript_4552:1-639(+)
MAEASSSSSSSFSEDPRASGKVSLDVEVGGWTTRGREVVVASFGIRCARALTLSLVSVDAYSPGTASTSKARQRSSMASTKSWALVQLLLCKKRVVSRRADSVDARASAAAEVMPMSADVDARARAASRARAAASSLRCSAYRTTGTRRAASACSTRDASSYLRFVAMVLAASTTTSRTFGSVLAAATTTCRARSSSNAKRADSRRASTTRK